MFTRLHAAEIILADLGVLLTGLLLAALLPLLTAGLSASRNPLRKVSAHIARLTDVSSFDQDAANHDHDGDSSRDDQGGHSQWLFAPPLDHRSLLRISVPSATACDTVLRSRHVMALLRRHWPNWANCGGAGTPSEATDSVTPVAASRGSFSQSSLNFFMHLPFTRGGFHTLVA